MRIPYGPSPWPVFGFLNCVHDASRPAATARSATVASRASRPDTDPPLPSPASPCSPSIPRSIT
jgi:hypothetical protein